LVRLDLPVRLGRDEWPGGDVHLAPVRSGASGHDRAGCVPEGTVPEPVPILEERFNLASAFRASATTGISGGLLIAILGAIGVLLFAVGRDRRARRRGRCRVREG
jgi:hypothetical protein